MFFLIYKNDKLTGYSTVPVSCEDTVVEVDEQTFNDAVILFDNNRKEFIDLKEWFDGVYTKLEQKYTRFIALNKLCDDGSDPNKRLIELYEEAEKNRKRIQELELF